MKLFITNKSHFEDSFKKDDYRNGYYKTSKQIHQSAFNALLSDVSKNYIPIVLLADYKEGGFAIFDFVKKNGEVYFYEYATTVS